MANKAIKAGSSALSGAAAGSALGPIGAIAGGALGLLGGLFSGGKSEEQKAQEAAIEQLRQIEIATPEERRIILQKLEEIGQLTPEMLEAIELGPTAYEAVTTDPALRQAQMDALARYQRKVAEGGLDLEDRAALEEIKRETARAARGQEEAILQNMAQRGMGGAGAELAARLAGSQASADRASQLGLNVAAQAQRRMAENIANQAGLARNIQSDELARFQQLAQARDIRDRFNVQNRQTVQASNVQAQNLAKQQNLDYKRRIAEANIDAANRQAVIDRQARLDYLKDKADKSRSIAGQGIQVGAASDASKKASDEGLASVIGGVGGVLKEGTKEGGILTKKFWE